jgi:hypothetical protein
MSYRNSMAGGALGTLALALVVEVASPRAAQMQEHDSVLTPVERAAERALALDVARVAVNEGGFGGQRPDGTRALPGAEIALIWQTVRGKGRTTETRHAWLRRHSSCVLTTRELTTRERLGNCAWTRNLRDDDSEPLGWPNRVPWARRVARWGVVRAEATSLVRGNPPRYGWPCRQDPDTWGGDLDHAHALAAGMTPLECVGTLNEGYLFAAPEPQEPR